MLPSPSTLTQSVTSLNKATRLWLRANTRILNIVADTLHSVALLTPSANAELRAEAAATAVSILTLYRDYPPPSSFSKRRSLVLLALNLLNAVQLLVEMTAARRNSQTAKPQLAAVTFMEAAKAFLRLSLLNDRPDKSRILSAADQTLPEPPPPPVCTCGMADVPGADKVNVLHGSRTSRAILKPTKSRPLSNQVIAGLEPPPSNLRAHTPTDDPILEALFTIAYERRANWVVRLFMPDVRCEACSPPPPPRPGLQQTLQGIQNSLNALTPAEVAAEGMYIMRPVLHLLLIRRFGWRSWRAWSAALALDLASRAAMAAPKSDADLEERRRRMAQLVLYLGRSPLFDFILRRFIKRMTSPLRRVPVVGGITASAIDWVTLLQQYWFYMSAS